MLQKKTIKVDSNAKTIYKYPNAKVNIKNSQDEKVGKSASRIIVRKGNIGYVVWQKWKWRVSNKMKDMVVNYLQKYSKKQK